MRCRKRCSRCWKKPHSYAGQSSLRTYVTGILKFKIIDHLRASQKENRLETNEDADDSDLIDQLFLANGHTVSQPQAWARPDSELEQKDFFPRAGSLSGKIAGKNGQSFHDARMAGTRYRRNL